LDTQIEKSSNIAEFQKVNQSFFSSMKLNIKHALPAKCRFGCCKETTRDRLFYRGYQKLRKEIEIQTIIKTLRVVKAASKRAFTKEDWKIFRTNNELGALHLTSITKKTLHK